VQFCSPFGWRLTLNFANIGISRGGRLDDEQRMFDFHSHHHVPIKASTRCTSSYKASIQLPFVRSCNGQKGKPHSFVEMLSHMVQYNPKDWRLLVCSPGGCDLAFVNVVDRANSWYTPEGMTAAEIMQIPRAKRLFGDESGAERYIKLMAEKKKRAEEKGIFQD
jgi:hypothetical protein